MPEQDELGNLLDNSTAQYKRLLDKLTAAIFRGNQDEITAATEALGRLIASSQTLADLLGREQVVKQAGAASEGKQFADARLPAGLTNITTPVVPKVTFQDAVDDILQRTPYLAESYKEVQNAYNLFHGFALARSTTETLTKKVQKLVAQSIEDGKPVNSASQAIAELGDYNQAYAETVYRTNLTTAYTAGTIKMAKDPAISQVMVAYEYSSRTDSNVRDNHRAMDGTIAKTTDPIWTRLAPPNGYRCRCHLRLVSRFELARRGIELPDSIPIPSGAYPDPGFEKRGDAATQIYGQ
jgi:SPP1 gp7 family putative phage head morphogenesis protein